MMPENSETKLVGSPPGGRLPRVFRAMSKLAMARPKFAPGRTTGRPIEGERRDPAVPPQHTRRCPGGPSPAESRHGPNLARRVEVEDAPPRPRQEAVPVRGHP